MAIYIFSIFRLALAFPRVSLIFSNTLSHGSNLFI